MDLLQQHRGIVVSMAHAARRVIPARVASLDDLMQTGYLALAEVRIDESRPPAAIAFYLRQVVYGAMIDSTRGRAWREAQHASLVVEMEPRNAAPPAAEEDALIARLDRLRRSEELVPLVALLPARQRRVIELRYFSDPPHSQREAGVAMGITQAGVSQLERRALASLRSALAGNGDDGQAA